MKNKEERGCCMLMMRNGEGCCLLFLNNPCAGIIRIKFVGYNLSPLCGAPLCLFEAKLRIMSELPSFIPAFVVG